MAEEECPKGCDKENGFSAIRESSITVSVNTVENKLEKLNELIERLNGKLEPVLRDNVDASEERADKPSDGSHIKIRLDRISDRLDDFTKTILSTIDILDI